MDNDNDDGGDGDDHCYFEVSVLMPGIFSFHICFSRENILTGVYPLRNGYCYPREQDLLPCPTGKIHHYCTPVVGGASRGNSCAVAS